MNNDSVNPTAILNQLSAAISSGILYADREQGLGDGNITKEKAARLASEEYTKLATMAMKAAEEYIKLSIPS